MPNIEISLPKRLTWEQIIEDLKSHSIINCSAAIEPSVLEERTDIHSYMADFVQSSANVNKLTEKPKREQELVEMLKEFEEIKSMQRNFKGLQNMLKLQALHTKNNTFLQSKI